jgi:hypothetical protein
MEIPGKYMHKKTVRGSFRTAVIRIGILLLMVSLLYLAGGLLGWLPLELETITWNNIRIVSGVSILGCLMAAIGFGNE